MTVIGKGLALENRHTGEKLEMTRVIRANQSCLAMRGLLPPHRQGPPLHVHYKVGRVGVSDRAVPAEPRVKGEPQ